MADFEFKPAHDLDLSFTERLASIRRDPGVFSLFFRWLWWALVKAHMKVWHRFEAVGVENLPQDLPFVMVANHSSHLDVISLLLALPVRLRSQTFPLAAADHFFGEIPAAFFTATFINALPMSRQGDGKGIETLRYLRRRMAEDKCGILLFPEGTRTRTGAMGRFRSGIGALVAGTDVPVVPCYLEGAYAAWPPTRRFPRPTAIRLFIGKPRTFLSAADGADECKKIAGCIEEAVNGIYSSRR